MYAFFAGDPKRHVWRHAQVDRAIAVVRRTAISCWCWPPGSSLEQCFGRTMESWGVPGMGWGRTIRTWAPTIGAKAHQVDGMEGLKMIEAQDTHPYDMVAFPANLDLHSDSLTWKWKNGLLEDYFPLQTVGFPLPC